MVERSIKVLVSLILFLGATLINFLASADALYIVSQQTNNFFKASKGLWLIGLGMIYMSYQVWLLRPRPATKGEIERMRNVVEDFYLNFALKVYYEILTHREYQDLPPVRINVMLRQRRYWFIPSKLRIVYQVCANHNQPFEDSEEQLVDLGNTGCYSDKEIRWLWKSGEGTCGQSVKYKEVVIFDSKDGRFGSPGETLRQGSTDIAKGVASVLSIPLWDRKRDRVIGVLNIDSKYNIDKTHFDDVSYKERITVVGHFKSIAEGLSIVLRPFSDGFYGR